MRPLPPANPGLRSGHEVRPADLSPALLLLPGANGIELVFKEALLHDNRHIQRNNALATS